MARIQMTTWAKFALLFLRVYLVGIIILIAVKFLRIFG